MTDEQFLILSNSALAALVGIGAVIESLPEPGRGAAVQKLFNWKASDLSRGDGRLSEFLDIMVPDDYAVDEEL